MDDNIIAIDLKTQTAPKVTEVASKEWIEYGTDDGKYPNLYPMFLIDLYYSSSTHSAIINATRDMIAGEGIQIEEGDSVDTYVKLQDFVNNVNGKETMHDLIKKIAFDYKLQGAFALQVIWNKARTGIKELHHIGVEKIRAGKPNERGVIDTYYICADWSDIRKHKPVAMPAFDMNNRTNPVQIMYEGDYSPNMEVYYSPDYSPASNWCLIDSKIASWHLANVSNGMMGGNMFVNFANGVPSQQERVKIEQQLQRKFSGEDNSGKLIITFSDGQDKTPVINPITMSNSDKTFLALQELIQQNVLTGHRVTSPMLFGIKNNTGLGSNVDELNTAFEVYLNSVIKPYQEKILRCIKKILDINRISLPIDIIQSKPITSKFSVEDMKSVMTQDEIREELGLPALKSTETVEEDDFSKLGVDDNVNNIGGYPVYRTKEEAEKKAIEIGCKGSHKHVDDNGYEWYMPCVDHDQITNLSLDCGCKHEFISPNPCTKGYEPYGHKIKDGKKVPNCVPIKLSNLEKFIYAYGEDAPDDNWQMLSDEIVIDEHSDFNFEAELNNLHRVEFVSTGTATPNADSEDEGIDRNFNYYKVRYRYSTAIASENTRDFCKKMLAANKLYSKENLLAMETQVLNKGFGPGGSDTYDIFKFKGGVNCGHYWRREIYFYKLGISTGTDIKDATRIITTTEARANGFYPETNPQEVSRAPKNMPNNGRKN